VGNAADIHHFVKRNDECAPAILCARARASGKFGSCKLSIGIPAALPASSEQLSENFPETISIDFEPANIPGRPAMIVQSWPGPRRRGFPAVAHVYRSPRHDQIVTVAKEHIATGKHHAATLNRRQINLTANLLEAIPIRNDFAKHTQTRDATVGVNFETKVRPAVSLLMNGFCESPFRFDSGRISVHSTESLVSCSVVGETVNGAGLRASTVPGNCL
jgi:hypothetical protein